MTTTYTNLGYLDGSYLVDAYISGSSFNAHGLQFKAVIESEPGLSVQFSSEPNIYPKYGIQFKAEIETSDDYGIQSLATISDYRKNSGIQWRADVTTKRYYDIEYYSERGIAHTTEVSESGYLSGGYCSGAYLGAGYKAHLPIQFFGTLNTFDQLSTQYQGNIAAFRQGSVQWLSIINAKRPLSLQFFSLKVSPVALQYNVVIYNTDNLRILVDFPSRGLDGKNWTATNFKAGHFHPNNLNTDVTEEIWRTDDGITTVTLNCDTQLPQGVFIDTLAILNHNISTSADVTLIGSSTPDFQLLTTSEPIQLRMSNESNYYYIAEEYPRVSYRYWRVVIIDPTNPFGYIFAGSIMFGSSLIFQGECFIDEVAFTIQDFTDTVKTAGFTNVANTRAMKKKLSLEFRFLNYLRANFRNMRQLFLQQRTVLKSLWIPTPSPYDQDLNARFAIFGKLVAIPQENHKSMGQTADYVSFAIDIDESL